jgi:hypothetical protein
METPSHQSSSWPPFLLIEMLHLEHSLIQFFIHGAGEVHLLMQASYWVTVSSKEHLGVGASVSYAQEVAKLRVVHGVNLLAMKKGQGPASSIPNLGVKHSPQNSSVMDLAYAANAVSSSLLIGHHMHIPNVGGTVEQGQRADVEWCLIVTK